MNNFQSVSYEELENIDGGGKGLRLGAACVVAVAAIVGCCCPPAGAIVCTAIGAFSAGVGFCDAAADFMK